MLIFLLIVGLSIVIMLCSQGAPAMIAATSIPKISLIQGGQHLEKPWKTLKSLEFVTGALKTLKNYFLKKNLEKHEFALKNIRMCLFSHF